MKYVRWGTRYLNRVYNNGVYAGEFGAYHQYRLGIE